MIVNTIILHFSFIFQFFNKRTDRFRHTNLDLKKKCVSNIDATFVPPVYGWRGRVGDVAPNFRWTTMRDVFEDHWMYRRFSSLLHQNK